MVEVVPDGPVDPRALAEFEVTLPAPLPELYRSWLLEVGGGEAAQDYRVANGVLSEFLTLGGELGYDLASYRRTTSGFGAWVPKDYLIIAPGSGGSLCLLLTGDGHADPLPEIMVRLSDDLLSFVRGHPRDSSAGRPA